MALLKLSFGGEQFGPHTEKEIGAMLTEGSIDRTAQVWQDGWPAWRSVESIIPIAAITEIPARASTSPLAYTTKLRPKSVGWMARYKARVGHRSFIFQVTLAAWTLVYLLWLTSVGITAAEAIASIQSSYTPPVASPSFGTPRFRPAPPPPSSPSMVGATAGILTSAMGAGAGWAIIGLPLFISAVATMESNEKK